MVQFLWSLAPILASTCAGHVGVGEFGITLTERTTICRHMAAPVTLPLPVPLLLSSILSTQGADVACLCLAPNSSLSLSLPSASLVLSASRSHRVQFLATRLPPRPVRTFRAGPSFPDPSLCPCSPPDSLRFLLLLLFRLRAGGSETACDVSGLSSIEGGPVMSVTGSSRPKSWRRKSLHSTSTSFCFIASLHSVAVVRSPFLRPAPWINPGVSVPERAREASYKCLFVPSTVTRAAATSGPEIA